MSLHTFLNEFYPTDAHDCKTDLEAVRHCKQKWSGRLPENLAKHEVKIFFFSPGQILPADQKLTDVPITLYKASTCALCIPRTIAHTGYIDCTTCPIKLAVGTACDESHTGTVPLYWMALHDPQIMLDALDKAETYLLAQEPSE